MAWIEKAPSGRWRASWRDPAGRKRRRTFRRKSDAERFLATIEADKIRGQYHDPALGRMTLGAFWSHYISGAEHHLRPSSLSLYRSLYRRYIEPVLAPLPLGRITRLDVENLIRELSRREVGAPSVTLVLKLLRRVLSAAVADGRIARNPAAGVSPPRIERHEMRFVGPDEIERIVSEVGADWAAFVLLGAYGGLRIGEICALRVDRLDWLRRSVRVEEAYAEVGGRLHLGPTKGGSRRQVTLPAFVIEAVAHHLEAHPAPARGLVFRGAGGAPVYPSNFRRKVWRPALSRIGLQGLRFHDLRHSSVAMAIRVGAHPKAIQARAGHASIRTTLDIYGHLFPGADEELARRMEEFARGEQRDTETREGRA